MSTASLCVLCASVVQKIFRDLGLTKHIKYVLKIKPDPRQQFTHLGDAGDLQ
ncbi:hypothetical protein CKA32_003275 [Geitlerinema sp. FC II]|nr:hypothetical protein CKA32_003275 [Geitlerinema sp. FC II]